MLVALLLHIQEVQDSVLRHDIVFHDCEFFSVCPGKCAAYNVTTATFHVPFICRLSYFFTPYNLTATGRKVLRQHGQALQAPPLFLETRWIIYRPETTERRGEAKQDGLSVFYKHTTEHAELITTFNWLANQMQKGPAMAVAVTRRPLNTENRVQAQASSRRALYWTKYPWNRLLEE
jgi:hypothetical protein